MGNIPAAEYDPSEMGDIPNEPTPGLQGKYLQIFFLITSILRNNFDFVVFNDGRFEWLMLDQNPIVSIERLKRRIRIDQIDWNILCMDFFENYKRLPFLVDQSIKEIDWNNVIFLRRTLMIRLEDGRHVLAKYVEKIGHQIKCIVRETNEEIIIPLSSVVNHIPSRKDILDYDKKIAQQRAAKRSVICQFPQIQRNYPLFSEVSMKVLFLLCKRFGIALDFTYQFNLLVRRLVCLGDQSIYSSPQLAEEDQDAFMAFMERYMNQFVGRVIVSNTIRFQQSNLPDNKRGLFEIHCYRNQNYSPTQEDVDFFLSKSDEFFDKFAVTILENALSLPDTYWTQAEFGVLTKQKKGYGTCLFLFPMPKEFPKDIFE